MALLAVGAVAAVAVLVVQSLVAGEAVNAQAAANVLRVLQFAGLVLPLPFLVFWAVGNGRLRRVAPLVLAGLTMLAVANFAAMKGLETLYGTEAGGRALAAIGGGQWPTTHYGGYVLLVLPAGWFTWRLLLWLSRGYERKRFSDAQLLAASFWLIFATSVWILLVPSQDPRVFLAGCAACAACALAWAALPLVAEPLPGAARGRSGGLDGRADPPVPAALGLPPAHRADLRPDHGPVAAAGAGDDHRRARRYSPAP